MKNWLAFDTSQHSSAESHVGEQHAFPLTTSKFTPGWMNLAPTKISGHNMTLMLTTGREPFRNWDYHSLQSISVASPNFKAQNQKWWSFLSYPNEGSQTDGIAVIPLNILQIKSCFPWIYMYVSFSSRKATFPFRYYHTMELILWTKLAI